MAASETDWTSHALGRLSQAGHRSSAPRAAVVQALAELGCGVTAREIDDHLRSTGGQAGLASIYRSLELLHRHRLVSRIDVGEGVVRYEPLHPGGEHHHHIVCDVCGKVSAFEDDGLERAIHKLSGTTDFEVRGHDVTLRGECPDCKRD
jgi:Fur family ferric uptake transcriptional regulator